MPVPTTASSFSVFTAPPKNLSLEYTFDFHLKENPDHPAFVHPSSNGGFRYYTYGEVVPAIHQAGRIVSDAIGFDPSQHGTPVVALLAKTDTLTYATVLAGLLRAGITAFPISPRFSPSVVAHVLRTAKPHYVLVTEDTRSLANLALSDLQENCDHLPFIYDIPGYQSLYKCSGVYEPLPRHNREVEETALIIHSSSSSSLFPKTISWTSEFILQCCEVIDYATENLTSKIFGFPALELFHSAGLCFMFWMPRTGYIMGILDPQDPASIFPIESSTIFRNFDLLNPEFIFLSPRVVETWSTDPMKVSRLRGSTIITGGRFLSRFVGDMLVKQGVNVSTAFGSTETGCLSFLHERQGEYWEYWTVAPRPEINFIARADGLYEIIVLSTAEKALPVCNTIFKGRPAYNLGDLFIPHPTKPDTFRICGRISDQVMLATGEMVNPIPIEAAIAENPSVSSAVVFGHTRFSLGVIVDPKQPSNLNTHEAAYKEDFLDELWPAIQNINQTLPAHAVISRNMIIVTCSDRPFMYSPKEAPRRFIVWRDYQHEIDEVYSQESANPR